ncbi:MAG: hypothetical protein ACT4P7_20310 [Gemmatimonadaceae bacterium]
MKQNALLVGTLMILEAALAAQPLSAQWIRPPRPSASATSAPTVVAIAAQGVDSSTFLNAPTVSQLTEVLSQIWLLQPRLSRLVPEGQFWAVELFVDSALASHMMRTGRHRTKGHFLPHWTVETTGSRDLDETLVSFASDSLTLRKGSGPGETRHPVLRVTFRNAMNIPVVLDRLRSIEGVVFATVSPDDGLQTGHRYRITGQAGSFRVEIDEAVGDCSMSCSNWIRWIAVSEAGHTRIVGVDTVRAP